MVDQNGLTILSKEHQIPFPVTRLAPLVDVGRAPIDGHSVLDMIHRATAFVSTPTPLAFSTGQIVPPAVVLGAADLRIDKPIDRLIADDRTSLFLIQSSGDLGRRPTLSQTLEYLILKIGLTQQPTSPPTPALGLLFSVRRLITDLSAAVAFKLSRYSRWRAIHSCRDLADCFPGLAKSGKRTALFKRKLFIALSHCNTLSKKCCTWFVNLGNPGSFPLKIINPQIFPIGILCLDQLQLLRPIPFLDLLLPCYSGNNIV